MRCIKTMRHNIFESLSLNKTNENSWNEGIVLPVMGGMIDFLRPRLCTW